MPSSLARYLLFFSSYSPLLVILGLRNFDLHCYWSLAFFAVAGSSIMGLAIFLIIANTLEPHPMHAETIDPKGSESMGYVITYILPFLGIDLAKTTDLFSLMVLLSILALIYVNSNLIYINPLLNLFGYRLFSVKTDDGKTAALLSKEYYIPHGSGINVVSAGDYVMIDRGTA